MMDVQNLVYRFDGVEIDVSNVVVRLQGEVRALEPKSFKLLVLLVQNRGRAVGKDEIMAAVWADTAVSDNSLARGITQIRKALDDPKTPRYIETVPTVGYRFTGECKIEITERGSKRRRKIGAIVAVAGLAVVVVASIAVLTLRPSAQHPFHVTGVSKLTSYVGDERELSVSPDGSLVAFSWSGPRQDNYDIYVIRPGIDQPLRLTQDPAPDSYPAWAPDGSKIAFIRQIGQSAKIIVVPPLGGPARILHHFLRLGADIDFSQQPELAWAPDGRSIVYSGLAKIGDKYRLYALSLETGDVEPLSTPVANESGDGSPAVSSDGKFLAFVRYLAPRDGQVMIQPLDSHYIPKGAPSPLLNSGLDPSLPIWIEDGKELLFADSGQIFE